MPAQERKVAQPKEGRSPDCSWENGRYRPSLLCARSQPDYFAQHLQAVAEEINFAALGMVPSDWNFADAQTSALRQIKQLYVEREALDPSYFEDWSARVEAERLEAALRVPKGQPGGEPHQKIEHAARLLAAPWLMNSDQAAVHRARAKRDVHFAICDGLDELRCLLKRRGKIGIGKKADWPLRGEQSGPHRGALSAIRKIFQQTRGDLCRL